VTVTRKLGHWYVVRLPYAEKCMDKIPESLTEEDVLGTDRNRISKKPSRTVRTKKHVLCGNNNK
jgi:hypothetical protein